MHVFFSFKQYRKKKKKECLQTFVNSMYMDSKNEMIKAFVKIF